MIEAALAIGIGAALARLVLWPYQRAAAARRESEEDAYVRKLVQQINDENARRTQ